MSIIYYTPEEQAAHRRLWADRLAKHDLEQAFGALRNDCGYCVLGVGCEVFYASTGLGHWEIEDGDFWFVVPDDDPMVTTRSGIGLPDQVMEFYGFEFGFEDRSFNAGMSNTAPTPFPLSGLTWSNDEDHMPFDMLADIIRNEPPGLVVGKE